MFYTCTRESRCLRAWQLHVPNCWRRTSRLLQLQPPLLPWGSRWPWCSRAPCEVWSRLATRSVCARSGWPRRRSPCSGVAGLRALAAFHGGAAPLWFLAYLICWRDMIGDDPSSCDSPLVRWEEEMCWDFTYLDGANTSALTLCFCRS